MAKASRGSLVNITCAFSHNAVRASEHTSRDVKDKDGSGCWLVVPTRMRSFDSLEARFHEYSSITEKETEDDLVDLCRKSGIY